VALADRERVLGTDHPDTLTSRDNLAGAYESAGRTQGVVGWLRAARFVARRAPGEPHVRHSVPAAGDG